MNYVVEEESVERPSKMKCFFRKQCINLLAPLIALFVVPPAAFAEGLLSADIAKVVNEPTGVILFSLEPTVLKVEEYRRGIASFHRYKILGSVPIKSKLLQKSAASYLQQGIHGTTFCGFIPHHGLRFFQGEKLSKDYVEVDLVLCFHCNEAYIYKQGHRYDKILLTQFYPAKEAIGRKLEALLNDILVESGISISAEYRKELEERKEPTTRRI
jgi:hypothetical protein